MGKENAAIAMRQMIAKGRFDARDLRAIGEEYPNTMARAIHMCGLNAHEFHATLRANGTIEFTYGDAETLAESIGMPSADLHPRVDTKPDETYDPRTQKKLNRSTGLFGKSTIMRTANEKYMTRLWLGRLRLHIFFRGDDDQDAHDHPWSFYTFPFASYVEEVTEEVMRWGSDMPVKEYRKRLQVVPAWRLNFRPAEHCHRVLGLYTGFVRDDFGFVHRVSAREANNLPTLFTPQWMPLNGRKLVTIVWRSGFLRMWGFTKNRDGKWCFVPFKEYIESGGSPGPCE